MNDFIFNLLNSSSLASNKKSYSLNQIFSSQLKRHKATLMSRFIYGYYGDGSLCVTIYIDILEGQTIWATEFFKGLARLGDQRQTICINLEFKLTFWLGHVSELSLVCVK